MEIQCLSAVCVCARESLCAYECVRTQPISLSDELLSACRRAEAESAPPIPQMQLWKETGGRGHFRRYIWKCRNSPPWQGSPSLFTSRSSHSTGKADGVVGEERARRWQAGGLERGSLLRHHVNEGDHRRHRLRVTQLISSSQPPFFHSTHTCTWMSTRSYVEMFIHKCYWQGRYSKIKMATFPVWTHDIWRSVGTYVTPGCVVCQAGLCVCVCGCGCVSTILPLRPFPHSFQSN